MKVQPDQSSEPTTVLSAQAGPEAASLQHYIRNLEIQARINTRSKSHFCRIRRSIVYMQEHLGKRLTLRQLSKISAMSEFHYAREFKYQTGTSPMTYLTLLRVEHAKLLIQNSQASFCAIAGLCGFGTQAHFCTVFKRSTGLTPTAYRRSLD